MSHDVRRPRPPASLARLDRALVLWMARHGVDLLRVSLGAIFLWFGALKLFPDLSPAEALAAGTISRLSGGMVPPSVSIPVLALWEVAIGLGLLSRRFLRATLGLLWLQMIGTLTPLVLFPAETFRIFPVVPTLEGQYILKNLILVSAGLVIGATVRGGHVVAESPGPGPR